MEKIKINYNYIKIVAMITMVIDHLAVLLIGSGPLYELFRAIGRIAAPLYLFMFFIGLRRSQYSGHDRDVKKTLMLLFISLISQPIHKAMTGDPYILNIVFGMLFLQLSVSIYKSLKLYKLNVVHYIYNIMVLVLFLSLETITGYSIEYTDMFVIYFTITIILDSTMNEKISTVVSSVFISLYYITIYSISWELGSIMVIGSIISYTITPILIALTDTSNRRFKDYKKLNYLYSYFYPIHLYTLYLIHFITK